MEDNMKIVVAGCSFSCTVKEPEYPTGSYPNILNSDEFSVDNISVSGNSNDGSIRSIYEYIRHNNSNDTTFILQCTFLHRIGGYFNFLEDWFNIQPNYRISNLDIGQLESLKINEMFDSTERNAHIYGVNYNFKTKNINDLIWRNVSDTLRDDIIKYYRLWLKLKYDDNIEFNELLFKIDLLNAYVSQSNNKLICMYWPPIEDEYLSKLKEYNFINIDGEYSILNWSLKNKFAADDTHLYYDGHKALSKILKNSLK